MKTVYNSIFEISAFGWQEEGVNHTQNLALGKSVTSNSTTQILSGVNFVPDLITDGNLGTRWSAVDAPLDDSHLRDVTIDLGEIYALSDMTVHYESAPAGYVISVSEDGINYTVLADKNPCSEITLVKRHALNTSARYVRIALADSHYTSIYEVLIY